MRISIGIFAYNSAKTIEGTIESLFSQSLFFRIPEDILSIEVVCLANGCTDSTVEVAGKSFQRHSKSMDDSRLSCSVREIAAAGKSNAWNEFVHRFSDPAAEVLFCMDADVTLVDADALMKLMETLQSHPEIVVAVGQPVKHLKFKAERTGLDRISLAASELVRRTRNSAIAGGLYCIRAPFARTCWMPRNLQVEDGFLRAMVVTNQFRSKDDPSRVQMIPDARVCSEAYTAIKAILRHEIRLLEGSVVNSYLYSYLWTNSGSEGAGALIARRNTEHSGWLKAYVNTQLKTRGSWVIPRAFLTDRLASLFRLKPRAAVVFLPVAILRTLVDWYVALIVNARLRKGSWGAW